MKGGGCMALVKCPECGREISNKAASCPGCGYPMENNASVYEPDGAESQENKDSQQYIFLELDRGGAIEMKDGILTFHSNPTMCYCPPAPISEYILQYASGETEKNVCFVLNHPRMDSPKKVRIKKNNDQYENAKRLLEALKEYATLNLQEYAWAATGVRTSAQVARDNRLIEKDIQKRQDQQVIKLEKRAAEQQVQLMEQQQKLVKAQQKQLKSQVKCPKCGSNSISYDTKRLSIGRALAGDVIAGTSGAILGGLSSKKGYAVCLKCGKRWKI